MEVLGIGGEGVVVYRVYRGSWADRGGLASGDIILKLNGKRVLDLTRLVHLVGTATPEQAASVKIARDGRVLTRSVTIGEGEMEAATVPQDAAPPYSQPPGAASAQQVGAWASGQRSGTGATRVPEMGMEVAAFAPGGVVVTRIYRGSPAERGGLLAGDLIVKFSGRNVPDPPRFVRLVHAAPPESSARIRIIRAGDVLTRTVAIGEGEMQGVAPIQRW